VPKNRAIEDKKAGRERDKKKRTYFD